jgi:hypothetical protein
MAITNGYASLSQVKAAARITDAVDDTLLELSIESASRMIDQHCGRRFFTNGTETRVFVADNAFICQVDDVAGTAITVKTSDDLDGVYDTTWTASDFQAEPLNRNVNGIEFPTTRLRAVGDYLFPVGWHRSNLGEAGVQVTAQFGFGTAVPTDITHATMIASLRLFKRFDSVLGVAGIGPDMGVVRVSRVDADVAALLAPFRKHPVGVA